ncbi:right-handed parallel beta-helix repeat-containing protein [Flavicella sediminum]|uniref:right-handed parallel beta-helix repeat-containing protein n=1 Tax=Flavicella sediminum TaxID=2585141 RepID=UPI00111D9682|nr:right-handed parallel beta-helix repeat-containing protein [Flavicella sediminum]
MRNIFSFIFVFLLLNNSACTQPRKFTYREVPSSLYEFKKELCSYRKEAKKLASKAYDLTQLLPENYVKDASVDYSAAIQIGIYDHDTLVFPNFPLLISAKGITVPSNKIIVFPEKSKLIMSPNDLKHYEVLRLHNSSHIKLYFPNIVGERYDHLNKLGEWGMGVSIRGSNNIEIINPIIKDCWGDGIYLGTTKKINQDVKIYYPVIDNCRRNGISVISCVNLLLEKPVVSNTNGTLPSCGIDFEPNTNKDLIDKVIVNNPVTYNNYSRGILAYLRHLRGDEVRSINMKIIDPIDYYSKSGFNIDQPSNKDKLKKKINGEIRIVNPKWQHNLEEFNVKNNVFSPQINVLKE